MNFTQNPMHSLASFNIKSRNRNLLILSIILIAIFPIGMGLKKIKAPPILNSLLLFGGLVGASAATVKLKNPETARNEHIEDGLHFDHYKGIAQQIDTHTQGAGITHQANEIINKLDAIASQPASLQIPLLIENDLMGYALAINPSLAGQLGQVQSAESVAGTSLEGGSREAIKTDVVDLSPAWVNSEISDQYTEVIARSRTTGYAFVGAAGDAKTVAVQLLIWLNIQQHKAHPHGHILMVSDRHQTSDDLDFIPHWLGVPKREDDPLKIENGVWKNSFYDLVMMAEKELDRRVERELTTDKVPMIHLCLEELKGSYRKLSADQVGEVNNAIEALCMEGRKYGMNIYVVLHSPVENSGKKSGKGLSLEAFRTMTKFVGYGIANAPSMLPLCFGKMNMEAGLQRMARLSRDPRGWLISLGGVLEDNHLPPLMIQSTRQLIIDWQPCDGPGNTPENFTNLDAEFIDPARTITAVALAGRLEALWQHYQQLESFPSDEGLLVLWERFGHDSETEGFSPSSQELRRICEMTEREFGKVLTDYLASEEIAI